MFPKGLWALFGYERVFPCPVRGSFPLLGLEAAKVAFLDEWRCNASVPPYSVQRLWFDESPVPIARPQNIPGAVGHHLYKGTAPVFVTAKFQDMDRLRQAAAVDPEIGLPANGDASMIVRRLKVHRYTQVVPKPTQQLPYCGRCFAKLIMDGCSWQQQG